MACASITLRRNGSSTFAYEFGIRVMVTLWWGAERGFSQAPGSVAEKSSTRCIPT